MCASDDRNRSLPELSAISQNLSDDKFHQAKSGKGEFRQEKSGKEFPDGNVWESSPDVKVEAREIMGRGRGLVGVSSKGHDESGVHDDADEEVKEAEENDDADRDEGHADGDRGHDVVNSCGHDGDEGDDACDSSDRERVRLAIEAMEKSVMEDYYRGLEEWRSRQRRGDDEENDEEHDEEDTKTTSKTPKKGKMRPGRKGGRR